MSDDGFDFPGLALFHLVRRQPHVIWVVFFRLRVWAEKAGVEDRVYSPFLWKLQFIIGVPQNLGDAKWSFALLL